MTIEYQRYPHADGITIPRVLQAEEEVFNALSNVNLDDEPTVESRFGTEWSDLNSENGRDFLPLDWQRKWAWIGMNRLQENFYAKIKTLEDIYSATRVIAGVMLAMTGTFIFFPEAAKDFFPWLAE